jgi:hypothetical protein
VDRRPSLGHDRTTSTAFIYLANALHEVAFYRRRWRVILRVLFFRKINSLSRLSLWPKLGRRSTVMPEPRYLIAPCHQQHDKGDPCMIIFADRIER